MASPTDITDTKDKQKELWRPLAEHKSDDGMLTKAGKCILNNPVTGAPLDLLRGAAGAGLDGLNGLLPKVIKDLAPWDGTLAEKVDGKKDEPKSYASNLGRHVAELVIPAPGNGNVLHTSDKGFDTLWQPLYAPGSKSKSTSDDSKNKKPGSSFTPTPSPAGGSAGTVGGTPLAAARGPRGGPGRVI